jgi:hypothetical protein
MFCRRNSVGTKITKKALLSVAKIFNVFSGGYTLKNWQAWCGTSRNTATAHPSQLYKENQGTF